MQLSRKPRGAASIFIIIALVLIIIALVIWYAFWGKPKTQAPSPSVSASTKSTEVTKADPYDGWKTYTLKYEKFSFKYPKDWTLTDTSTNNSYQYDKVVIKSTDGFALNINTGVGGIGGNCEDCKAYETTTETILGEKTGVNIFGSSKGAQGIGLMRATADGKTVYNCLGLCTMPSKNTPYTFTDGSHGFTMITGGYPLSTAEAIKLGTTDKTFPYDTFKADPNVATARLIFASMTY